ncbi:extracellular solute-binding protein [Rhodococcus aerolatus]
MLGRTTAGLRAATVAVAVALAAAACGGGDSSSASAPPSLAEAAPVTPAFQAVIDAAKREGSVTIYSSQGADLLGDLGKKFEAAYGIPVTVNRDVDANLEAKLDAESTSNQPTADVVALADGAYVAKRGQAGAWAQPAGPNFDVAAYDKAKNLDADGSFISSAAMYVMGWNTQNLPGGITSYQDLLKPELQGHVGIVDPAVSTAVVDFYDYVGQTAGPSFLTELAAQKPQIFAGALPAGQALTSGQIWAAIAVQPLVDEKADGAPVDFLVPRPAWGAPFHTGVLAAAPHPNAAQLLADFMVSPQGQAALGRKAASVLPDVGAVTTLSNIRPFEPATLAPDRIAEVRQQFKALFQS